MKFGENPSELYRSGDPSQLSALEIALSRCSWCLSAELDLDEEPAIEGGESDLVEIPDTWSREHSVQAMISQMV